MLRGTLRLRSKAGERCANTARHLFAPTSCRRFAPGRVEYDGSGQLREKAAYATAITAGVDALPSRSVLDLGTRSLNQRAR